METIMATQLNPAQMKDFVRMHFEDFVNKQRPEVIYMNMTPDFVDHNGPGNKLSDARGDEELMLHMYRQMPGLTVSIEDMIAEGDKVVCRNVWHWTDPTTMKRMEFHGFVLWRFEGNRIAERWATVTQPAEVGPNPPSVQMR